jgi:putative zinc finger/helix-turn-helix YgiT family protein
MRCYTCKKADLVPTRGTHDYAESGLPYPVRLVGVPVEECPACGERLVTIPNPEALHRALALGIVEANRPLLGAELRFLRKLLDLGAADFAALVGVDSKTLSRWENGRQAMGKVAERLVRLLVHARLRPDAADFADKLFPRLRSEGGPEPATFEADDGGWRAAA